MTDSNGLYCTVDGKVAASKRFLPGQALVIAEDDLFMPYEELHLPATNAPKRYKCKLHVSIYDRTTAVHPRRSDDVAFRVSR